jgi:hypothetical protein
LELAVLSCRDKNPDDDGFVADFRSRVKNVERAVCMMLRLPSGSGKSIRVFAYKGCINDMLEVKLQNHSDIIIYIAVFFAMHGQIAAVYCFITYKAF